MKLWVARFLLGGGLLAGASGLIVAGATMADVSDLRRTRPAVVERLRAVEVTLAGLKGALDERARADEREREATAEALRRIERALEARGGER